MAQTEVTLSKGSTTVTIYVDRIDDNFANKLFVIKPAQSTNNQSDGTKAPKVVDLLRVNHQMIIKGYITGTGTKKAMEVKRDLVNIWKGAGQDGGTVTLTYDSNASAVGNTSATTTTTVKGYIEKVNFTETSGDEPDDFQSTPSKYPHVAKFTVAITFIEGVNI